MAALAARYGFGRLAFEPAFAEELASRPFASLTLLWTVIAFAIPALLIGLLQRRVVLSAFLVELANGLLLYVSNPYGVRPEGSILPNPPILLLGLAEELVLSALISATLVIIVRLLSLKAQIGRDAA